MKLPTIKLSLTCLALVGMVGAAKAQTIASLGVTPPTPGTYDISQLSTVGEQTSPNGLNYYIDNGNAPGQTFTTGSNPGGYILNSFAIHTGTSAGGSVNGLQSAGFGVRVYSVAAGVATPVGSTTVGVNDFIGWALGDWLQVSGMAVALSPNSEYAITFQRNAGGSGWADMQVASGNPYAGGEICLVPVAGGAITLGSSHAFDAQFDIGLALPAAPITPPATATPNPCYALSSVTIADSAVSGTTYNWQTNSTLDGTHSGAWVNNGQTALSFTTIPANLNPGGADYIVSYRLVAVNGLGTSTSDPVDLTVHAATAPVISTDTTPATFTAFVGGILTLNASFVGTQPITNQWVTDAGQSGTYTNIPGATGTTLTVNNLQVTSSGHYKLRASNSVGTTDNTPAVVAVHGVIYKQTFNVSPVGDYPTTQVGWESDITGGANRIFSNNQNVTAPNCAVYSYDGGAATEAFYTTTTIENGSIAGQQALPIIDPSIAQDLSFGVDINSPWNGPICGAYFAVQMNWGQWYVSQTELTLGTAQWNWASFSQAWSSTGWNLLTVSGNGNLYNGGGVAPYPIVGAAAPGALTGSITGIGVVTTKSGGATIQIDNVLIGGEIPFNPNPVIDAPPFSRTNYTGTTATFGVSATTNGLTTGLSYQWKVGNVGSGTYVNLSNGGQFSGVNTATLTIANVTSANHKDYVVVVTDAAGSANTTLHPATLNIIDSAPLIAADTLIYPDASPLFGRLVVTNYAGNHNTLNITATLDGNASTLQWQFSPNSDGSAAVNVAGATSSTLTLADPQPSASGYYSLHAVNGLGTTNTAWASLTVLPPSPTLIHWQKPVPFTGLTAAQMLTGVPGTFFEAELFGTTVPQTVTVGSTAYVFAADGSVAFITGGVGNLNNVYVGPSSGDASMDLVLSNCVSTSSGWPVTINNLVQDTLYSVQLFQFNDTGAVLREAVVTDALDDSDKSPAYIVGQNVYLVGTFVADGSGTKVVHLTSGDPLGGYFNFVVVRKATPTVEVKPSGSSLELSWDFGTLVESTSVNGPWTPVVAATSPHLVSATGPQKFYRALFVNP